MTTNEKMTVTLIGGKSAEVSGHEEASRLVRAEIDASGMGGTEWCGERAGRLIVNGKRVAHVSYNGKVWIGKKWAPGSTPVFDPYEAR